MTEFQKMVISKKKKRWSFQFNLIATNQVQTLFLGAPKSLQMVTAAMKLKDAYSLEEKL